MCCLYFLYWNMLLMFLLSRSILLFQNLLIIISFSIKKLICIFIRCKSESFSIKKMICIFIRRRSKFFSIKKLICIFIRCKSEFFSIKNLICISIRCKSGLIWTSPTIVMKPDNNDGLEPQDRVDKICWTLTHHLTRWKPRLR